MIQTDEFTPFFGVVEDINDPQKLGRVRVRLHGYHSPNEAEIPTNLLQWFSCIVNNSSTILGRGHSPTGYEVGSTVFGYALDPMMQTGIVVGALAGRSDGINDVSALAREDETHQLEDIMNANRITGIRGPLRQGEWDEPQYTDSAIYPNNKTFETRSGHIFEVDDTPDNEHLLDYHRTGTYERVDCDGNKTVKVVGDKYEIVAGNDNVTIFGDVNLTIAGNLNQYVQGDWNIQVDGNKTEVIRQNKKEKVEADVSEHYGSHSTKSDGSIAYDGATIDLNSGKASSVSAKVTVPPEYDLKFVLPTIKESGRYLAFDEPETIDQTPDDYPDDTPPIEATGKVEESDKQDQEQATPETGDCSGLKTDPINYGQSLSRHFTIEDLSTGAHYPHRIQEQVGLSVDEILCNLKAVAQTILEPIYEEWGEFRITSGFRVGSGTSRHNRGMAVDIQEPSWSIDKHFELAEWIADNLPQDTIIFEHGNRVWLHIDFDRNKSVQRGRLLTMYQGNYEQGLKNYYA
jgi:hypothetical protein